MKSYGWPIIISLTAIPVCMWVLMMPVQYRFSNLSSISTSLGQLSGIIGMMLFSLSMILSVRLSLFDRLFGGLNRAYIVHHQVGGIAFLLLMSHPLLLAVVYGMNSFASAAAFLLPTNDWTINFGIAALLMLMSLLIFTYYVDLPYQLWRFTHKFMGIAFVFGIVHAYFVPSDIAHNPLLRGYMFIIMLCGLSGYVYKTILGRFFVPHYRYIVYSVKKLNESVTELILTPLTKKTLLFQPGQFVFIEFSGRKWLSDSHPFSISSKSVPQGFSLGIKSLGDFTSSLDATIGQEVRVEGPFGRFSPEFYPAEKYLWIAGGIGITPFVSMARSLSTDLATIDLYYLVRTQDELAYIQELDAIAKIHTKFRVIPWYSKTMGHLTGGQLIQYTPDITDRHVFLCGPPAMMYQMKKELRWIGVDRSRIISEEFSIS